MGVHMALQTQERRISRTGHLLVVLARAGQLLTVFGTLGIVYVLIRIQQPALPGHPGFLDALIEVLLNNFGETAIALVNGWRLLCVAIYIWALERIRRIGVALLHHPPISHEVADSVRRSARALLLCGFSTLLHFDIAWKGSSGIVAWTGSDRIPPATYSIAWELNWMAFYAVCLLCVCVLAIARILQEAVALKTENEGFV